MKKKFLECDRHGLTLFKVKRICWKQGSKKDKNYADEYVEHCFKCLEEGRYENNRKPKRTKKKHVGCS